MAEEKRGEWTYAWMVVSWARTNKFKAICKLHDKEVQVANNGCFALMQHAGTKGHKEMASVKTTFC